MNQDSIISFLFKIKSESYKFHIVRLTIKVSKEAEANLSRRLNGLVLFWSIMKRTKNVRDRNETCYY